MSLMWVPIGAILALLIVLLWRAFTFGQTAAPVEPAEGLPLDVDAAASHLSRAIQCKAISTDADHPPDAQSLQILHDELHEMYPLTHRHLKVERINDHALLYTWQGTDDRLAPILLAAHQDVVPVDPATAPAWRYPPFEGRIAEGYVWGRGTMDNKGQLIAVMEAVEALLQTGFRPQRSVYLGFGHDEEIGGRQGALQIARRLQEQNIHLEAVLDEGGAPVEGVLPADGLVALVGYAEKGCATIELSVSAEPGHSATPPRQTAIGILAQALTRLEQHPMPADSAAFRTTFEALGSAAPFTYRLLFANLWLFAPVVNWAMGKAPRTNALIRTTTTATMVSGGIKDNILPRQATARINSRILVGQSSDEVVAHIRLVVHDKRIQVRKVDGLSAEPSPASPTDAPAYCRLETAIRQTFGNIPVTPFLIATQSDARHYAPVCNNIYRFAPMASTSDVLERIHGINERMSIAGLGEMVQFYGHLIKVWTEA